MKFKLVYLQSVYFWKGRSVTCKQILLKVFFIQKQSWKIWNVKSPGGRGSEESRWEPPIFMMSIWSHFVTFFHDSLPSPWLRLEIHKTKIETSLCWVLSIISLFFKWSDNLSFRYSIGSYQWLFHSKLRWIGDICEAFYVVS